MSSENPDSVWEGPLPRKTTRFFRIDKSGVKSLDEIDNILAVFAIILIILVIAVVVIWRKISKSSYTTTNVPNYNYELPRYQQLYDDAPNATNFRGQVPQTFDSLYFQTDGDGNRFTTSGAGSDEDELKMYA